MRARLPGRQSEIHIAAAHRGHACHHPCRPSQGGGKHRPSVHGTGHRPNAVRQQQGSDQQLQITDQDRTGTDTEGVEPGLKAARTKAIGISPSVKRKVWARDKERCIFCQSPYAAPEAHYIRRSQGGLGIEQNIFTACRRCHRRFDEGTKEQREQMKRWAKSYLQSKYAGWKEEGLVYKKGAME
nr:MAG TPA: 5-methylcytosine-specific restriction enzyme A [Caudoviricetes sp.]